MTGDRKQALQTSRVLVGVLATIALLAVAAPQPGRAATAVRGAIATPVVQDGTRAGIRGTLGEAVVGTARGGSTLIRSGFHRPVLDTRGPEWTLGAFPNPYLDEFIDLVLVANEPLRDGSLSVQVGGVSVTPLRWPGSGHAWWVDNALSGPIAVSEIAACGADLAGNVGCFQAGVSARVFVARTGGRLSGADGATSLVVEPGALPEDARVLLATFDDGAAQILGPASVSAVIERDVRSLHQDVFDRTALHWVGPDGPIPSWLDADAMTLRARVDGAGTYRVEAGAPGSATTTPPTIAGIVAAPNPFLAATAVRFDLPGPRTVSLHVYDAAGRLVARPIDAEHLPVGSHERSWDGATLARGHAPAGIYFVRLTDGDREFVTKIVRLP